MWKKLRAFWWESGRWAFGFTTGSLVTLAFSLGQAILGKSTPTIVWLIVTTIAFGIGAFISWNKQYVENERYKSMFTQMPNLTVPQNGCYVDQRTFQWKGTTVSSANASCLHLRILNDPEMPVQQANALGVGATVTLFDPSQNEIFHFDARWSDSSQPTSRTHLESTFDLLQADIPIGRTREIDIAVKYPGEVDCYGFNNDSYQFLEFKKPKWRLVGNEFVAHVRIRGINVDKKWFVKFRNNPNGLELVACYELRASSFGIFGQFP